MGSRVMESCVPNETESSKWDHWHQTCSAASIVAFEAQIVVENEQAAWNPTNLSKVSQFKAFKRRSLVLCVGNLSFFWWTSTNLLCSHLSKKSPEEET